MNKVIILYGKELTKTIFCNYGSFVRRPLACLQYTILTTLVHVETNTKKLDFVAALDIFYYGSSVPLERGVPEKPEQQIVQILVNSHE